MFLDLRPVGAPIAYAARQLRTSAEDEDVITAGVAARKRRAVGGELREGNVLRRPHVPRHQIAPACDRTGWECEGASLAATLPRTAHETKAENGKIPFITNIC